MNVAKCSSLASVALLTLGCATSLPRGAVPRRQRNVITSEQMIAVNASTVYEGLEKLEPAWVASRGPTSLTNPAPTVPSVVIGGNEVGDANFLKSLRPGEIREVRYYPVGEASARFGMGHPGGVLEVVLGHRGPSSRQHSAPTG